MPTKNDETVEPTSCPNCDSSESSERETEQYVPEDGTKRRITYCAACVREKDDGTVRYVIISENTFWMGSDREMHGERLCNVRAN